jgi:protein SCO1/2
MPKFWIIAVAGGALALVAGFGAQMLLAPEADRFAQCRTSQVAGGDIGGPFELVSETGETVTEAEVLNEPALIYFGYTFCPDVCPLDAMRNALAVEELEDRGYRVKPVFISIDPQRDTPEVVAQFTDNFHERMIGLTGTPEQVRAASQAYRTFYQAQPAEEDDPFYLVDHTTLTYFTLPGIGFVDFFRRDDTPETIAERVACFIDAS